MFDTIEILLILIPLMPLGATVATAVLGAKILRGQSHWPTIVAIGLSCLMSLALVLKVSGESKPATEHADTHAAGTHAIGYEKTVTLWSWAAVEDAYDYDSPVGDSVYQGDFRINIVLRADPLTAIMLAMVTFVSLLVAIYSVGYMHDDPGYWRFFTYIPLFVFSMTMLVSVSNFVLLYVFWEAVGMCSYLLIGFWFQKPEAAAAGKKAFLVNRIGDFGFALGLFLLWTTYGTLDFHDTIVSGQVQSLGIFGQTMLATPGAYVTGGVGTAICLLLLLGACGKSAQFPLHVWLPDAMEGPTPVSALIHAATMVTAGVYMVARCTPLFQASTDAQHVVAFIGGFTALLAALIALTQTDLKRILAYSTISQLGYMFLGLGAATLLGITAGMFHLFTHAFFKALLFLGAGSVMHAMGGVIDVRQFGGLRRLMPKTHWTFLFGSLALAGVFPFAGFWSKDIILAAVHEQAEVHPLYEWLYLAGLFTAFLTAFYTFRAFFLTFYGKERIPKEAGHHAHESPLSMTGPLMILAVCALVVGAYFELTHGFAGFLERTPSIAYLGTIAHEAAGHAAGEGNHLVVAIISTAVALAGIGLAVLLYLIRPGLRDGLTRAMDAVGLYRLSLGKFYFDEIYNALVIVPIRAGAWLCYWIDRTLVDGLVNAVGLFPMLVGAGLRPLQNGMVQFYAMAMVLGLLVLIGVLLM
ncbi:MAG TPA: NADH-quinone oxidoreductase subunit L [Thermoguttaceae bacterium]|nr:NADH-quinone oxidoreductase subunit L [Thermoguttaceae bacterium]